MTAAIYTPKYTHRSVGIGYVVYDNFLEDKFVVIDIQLDAVSRRGGAHLLVCQYLDGAIVYYNNSLVETTDRFEILDPK